MGDHPTLSGITTFQSIRLFYVKLIFPFFVRLYRAYYEAKTSITEMWKGNPALTAVLFGLPLGFFALICYSICCADIMDAEDDEDEHPLEADMSHEKTD